ncbi:rRNA N6-adenosine-methyltransferase ZCCHC4-like isoform X3 [Daktulosphaira vitifoliae]|uniref:rRNA N6-adenosine-methyltransferase ZCCHC4-like isoform X3 n=1 Tax=Daktulosphaira vitifoliae TaxID=58002 RepID=UPI0021AAC9FA|nr:rRNA N6-adenosine-methyltransferase ZCCHC4-like isoform X3 [Daktulosphaira vitifoliae]
MVELEKNKNISVHMDTLEQHPHCSHGPTILFSRGLDGKKFYSCAAYRDKKKCSFFLWENQSGEKYVQQFERDPIISKMIRFKLQSRLKFVKSLNQENRIYCHKCNELLPKSEKHLHLEHEDFLQENIDDFKLSRPSQLQFYQCNDFRWFNLFNCYILEECDTKEILVDLLSKEDSMAVLIDPPFGGRLEPIAYTMKKFDDIRLKHNKNFLTKFLILPYFMERYVKSCLPEMSMLDYKVDYSNHKKFNDTGRNKGSPIRLFTNANQSKIPLPSDENYHFCEECNRWVSGENNHCYQCGGCMSKNGRKYIHCNLCKKCVKCTWKHCKKCKKCCLPDHRCINDQIKTSSKNKRQGQNKKYKSSINLKSTMIKKNIYNEEIKRF